MDFLDTVKNSLNTAVDTISTVTHTIIEKNRTNAQLNRLRLVMKNESEMINRAYIALGKHYYENSGRGKEFFVPAQNEKELFKVIETSKNKIKKARERYNQILENQTVEIFDNYDKGTIEDITVACSNEDEYAGSPFPVKEEKPQDVEDITVAVKDVAEDVADTVSEVAEDIKDTVSEIAENVADTVTGSETDENFSF